MGCTKGNRQSRCYSESGPMWLAVVTKPTTPANAAWNQRLTSHGNALMLPQKDHLSDNCPWAYILLSLDPWGIRLRDDFIAVYADNGHSGIKLGRSSGLSASLTLDNVTWRRSRAEARGSCWKELLAQFITTSPHPRNTSPPSGSCCSARKQCQWEWLHFS